jgi:hypothetical protein
MNSLARIFALLHALAQTFALLHSFVQTNIRILQTPYTDKYSHRTVIHIKDTLVGIVQILHTKYLYVQKELWKNQSCIGAHVQ